MKAGSPHKSLDDLPPGSVVGTSSVRRGAQILKSYPHLKLENARGNVYVEQVQAHHRIKLTNQLTLINLVTPVSENSTIQSPHTHASSSPLPA